MANETATLDLRNADAMMQKSALATYDDAMRGQLQVAEATKQGIERYAVATTVENAIMIQTEQAAMKDLESMATSMENIDRSESEIFGAIKGIFYDEYNVEKQQRNIDMRQFNIRRLAYLEETAKRATQRTGAEVTLDVERAQADVDVNVQRLDLMNKGMATQQLIEAHTLAQYDYQGLKSLAKSGEEQKRMGLSRGAIAKRIAEEEKRLFEIENMRVTMEGNQMDNSLKRLEVEKAHKERFIQLHTPMELQGYIEQAKKNKGLFQKNGMTFTTMDLENAQVQQFNAQQTGNKSRLDALNATLGVEAQLDADGVMINNALSNLNGFGIPLMEPPMGADGKVDPAYANLSTLERVNPNAMPAQLKPMLVRAQQYAMQARTSGLDPNMAFTFRVESINSSAKLRDALAKLQVDSAPKATKEGHMQFLQYTAITDDTAAYNVLGGSLNNRNAVAHPAYMGAYARLSDAFTGLVKSNGGSGTIDMDSPDVGIAALMLGGKKYTVDQLVRQAMDTVPASRGSGFSDGVTEKFVTDITRNGIAVTLAQLSANEQASATPMYAGLVSKTGDMSAAVMDVMPDGSRKLNMNKLFITLEERTQQLRKVGVLNDTQSLRDEFVTTLKQNISRFNLKADTTPTAAFQRALLGSANPHVMVQQYVDTVAGFTPEQHALMLSNQNFDAKMQPVTSTYDAGKKFIEGVVFKDVRAFNDIVQSLKDTYKLKFGGDQ